jgi:hypothetical protein
MSLVETLHADHKARMARMGGQIKRAYVPPASVIDPIDPEPYYAGMWFHNLITLPAMADKVQPIGRIQRAVAKQFNISVDVLTGSQRSAEIVLPRQIGYYLVRRLTTKSTREISRRFNRDHSSISHGVKKIERLMRDDAQVAEHINLIRARLSA